MNEHIEENNLELRESSVGKALLFLFLVCFDPRRMNHFIIKN